MKIVELLDHKGVKLYIELMFVWAVLISILFVSINLQQPAIEQAHIDAASTSSTVGQIDQGISTSLPAESYIYSYTTVKGDSLSISYRRIINKFLSLTHFEWSKGKRLYVEINLVKFDNRINRNIKVGEYVAADAAVIIKRGDEFDKLLESGKQTWEMDTAKVVLDVNYENVVVNPK